MAGGISIFLLIVIAVLVAVAVGVFAVSGGLARLRGGSRANSEDPEANARFDRGEQSEHTRVEDRGKQTYVGTDR
jgi:hypothetical protein